jgi:hypothetical protein
MFCGGLFFHCQRYQARAYCFTAMTARATDTSRACPVKPAARPAALASVAARNCALVRDLSGLWPGTRAPGGKPGLVAAGLGAEKESLVLRVAIVSRIVVKHSSAALSLIKCGEGTAAAAAGAASGKLLRWGGGGGTDDIHQRGSTTTADVAGGTAERGRGVS